MSQVESSEVIGYALVSTVDATLDVPSHSVWGFRTELEAYDHAASLLQKAGLCQRCEAGFWIVGEAVSPKSRDVFGVRDGEDSHLLDSRKLVEAAQFELTGTEYFHVFPILKPVVPAVA